MPNEKSKNLRLKSIHFLRNLRVHLLLVCLRNIGMRIMTSYTTAHEGAGRESRERSGGCPRDAHLIRAACSSAVYGVYGTQSLSSVYRFGITELSAK